MEYLVLIVLVAGFALVYFKKESTTEDNLEEDKKRILELEKSLISKEIEAKQQQQNIDIANAKTTAFEQVKTENTTLKEKLSNIEQERNNLKNENIFLKTEEENRNETLRKSIESTNTLQESLSKEKERLNDDRVKETEDRLENMKWTWGEHEKDIENHLQLICRNHVINYISQEDFPHSRNKPDNSIEIMDQLIVFDAKSPANDDLSNFPKYIKLQTESLKKYAKHGDVKKDLFLVIPSNTLHVINQFTYNIGDYNVYVITKDALEPIILSLKKIEEYEFADKLSPEERDNVCRIIGKFAHTTKRRIQIDQFFAEEFLDTLNKAGTQLPREILESVIQFENAEKLNPPMEKRKKQILTKDLKAKSEEIKKEIELRNIPEITTQIKFKQDNNE
ncbi:MAG: hypothetical protein HN522_04400 [Flavobacteriales bacterium]|jgi:hypothetical protein|nr:hypothetical protein [Flavobacteriales bacterium]MBT5090726.1 hypothetical protein [Flavobacteriales bacterium]MBT5750916.1 hypothetical protein [Flavobacteriales bacterium]